MTKEYFDKLLSLPHLPNLFFIFYFQTTKWNLSWPTFFFFFSQNGALNVLTDIPLFPCVCVCVCQGELRVVPLFLTNRYRRRLLPHSKISIMPLSVRLVSFLMPMKQKRTSPTLMIRWILTGLRAVYSFDIYFFLFSTCSTVDILFKSAIHH